MQVVVDIKNEKQNKDKKGVVFVFLRIYCFLCFFFKKNSRPKQNKQKNKEKWTTLNIIKFTSLCNVIFAYFYESRLMAKTKFSNNKN